MVDQDDGAALESRPPTLDDLIDLCRRLNEEGAEYVVIGGMAILQLGFVRATEDIDLLVDASPENFERLRRAMLSLPDQAIEEVRPTDLDEYVVVRVADEFVVDLMKTACGVDYQEARSGSSSRRSLEDPSEELAIDLVLGAHRLLEFPEERRARERDRHVS